MHRDTPDERIRCAPDVEKQTRFEETNTFCTVTPMKQTIFEHKAHI